MCFYRKASRWLISALLLSLFGLLSACGDGPSGVNRASHTVNVVAAENFYGEIARQVGGQHVAVTSILSDPNVDPHEYQSNVQTGITVSKADLVIENGGGYDDWMDKILSSAPNGNRLLLKGFDISKKLPENVHVWYSFDNAATIAQAIASDLKKLDPADAAIFESNLQTFKQSLQPLQQKITAIKARYNGTPVGLTETIYLYQTGPEG